ncbi:hypothetical protein ACFQU3_10695 [Terrabacter sp. GCM10028922]|uniref:hypothetical protein n=1 Tax=Terrabacter sp. GCM10028922 TaxID=3273428 RepID=UPI00361D67CF
MAESLQVSLPHGPDWFEWPDGAPAVMPGGINLLRSVIQPSHKPEGYKFDISVARADEPEESPTGYFGLLAEFQICSGEWVCGASALLYLQCRDLGLLKLSDHELIATYGPWGSHALWDVFVIHGRALNAGHGANITFPTMTPEPTSLKPSDPETERT